LSLFPSSYFAFFTAFSLWSFYDDIKSKVSPTRIVAEALSDIGLVTTSLAYWLPAVRATLGTTAPLVFGLALATFFVQLLATIRRRFPDPELPLDGNIFVFVTGTALVLLVSAPLLFWGFSAAVLHQYAGT
jgi:hypothetical protein